MLDVREIAPGRLRVTGVVDLASAGKLRSALRDAVDGARVAGREAVEVDLQDAQMRDATGLGVLIGAHRRAIRGNLRLSLVRPSPELSQLLLDSRLYRVLDIERDEAQEALPTEVDVASPPLDERLPKPRRRGVPPVRPIARS